ncbi:MAG: 3-dehydroquinate synthase, partial [Comamonadaceae bacterium]
MPMPASPPEAQRVDIALGDRSYPILIGAGLLGEPSSFDAVPQATSALIVT